MSSNALDELVDACLFPGVRGTAPPDWARRAGERGLGGFVLYGSNAGETGGLLDLLARPLRALRPDLLVAVDEEGGDVTRLHYLHGSPHPGNLALGAADDVELTRTVARAIGSELAAQELNLDLAPSVDVNVDPENPVIGTRSFGAGVGLVGRHGRAFVEGMQSCGVAACAKHFPGHGATRVDSHSGLPVVDCDELTLRERELAPFAAAIEAGVRALMSAHVVFPAVDELPATLSRRFLTGIVRDELGFEGAVFTDALEMGAIAARWALGEAAVQALRAGADALLVGDRDGERDCAEVRLAVRAAVETGELPRARLEQAAERVRALGAWASSPRAVDVDAGVGLEAARRALLVEGPLPLGAPPFVVHLRSRANPAVGEAHWSLAEPLAELGFLAGSRDVTEGEGDARIPGGRPLVVAVRNACRSRWQREWLLGHPDAVVVALGLPDDRELAGEAFVAAHGAGRANARAAAEALAGHRGLPAAPALRR